MDMFEQPAQARRTWDQGQAPRLAAGALEMSLASYVKAESHGRVRRPDGLTFSIETDILPRLLLSRRGGDRAVHSAPGSITGAEVERFTDLILKQRPAGTAKFVADLRARGILTDAVFLDLLGPSALLLGKRWDDDLCSFGDVTLGMLQLQTMLRDLIPVFDAEVVPRAGTRRALLVPAPGEQHGLGLQIVAAFLRRAGWQVWCGAPGSRQELLDMVRDEWFALVGLSTACTNRLESLTTAVRLIRRTSRNPAVGIMVGGPVFIEHPELATAIGADATAVDGRHAAQQAENVLDLMTSRG